MSLREGLIGNHCRLAGNIEALAAAHVFAGHDVILADHVRPELREAGAIAVVGAAGELPFLGADHPGHFVFTRLVAMRAVESGWLLLLSLVEKVAFFHRQSLVARRRSL